MIQIVPASARYVAEHGWLTSRFSFSFAEYRDSNNLQFGSLRVFNDDTIQPKKGFGMHPHADMEIVTCVLEGTLEHKDSMGNIGLIEAGEVQRMTAGTGIYHSEYNHSHEQPVHLLQLWFLPGTKNLTPSWEQRRFTEDQQVDRLLPVVSNAQHGNALSINQDVTIYLSRLSAGKELTHQQSQGRRMYVFIMEGAISLNEEPRMTAGDVARITELSELQIATEQGAHYMLIDLA